VPYQMGLRYIQWQLCDRCGLMYPITELRRQQGINICNRTCADNLDNQYRPVMIEQVLATPGEGSDERSEYFQGPGEEVVF
jgi:hypothetical protein